MTILIICKDKKGIGIFLDLLDRIEEDNENLKKEKNW